MKKIAPGKLVGVAFSNDAVPGVVMLDGHWTHDQRK